MKRSTDLLEDHVSLLVKHFGIRRVRAAIAKFADDRDAISPPANGALGRGHRPTPSVARSLESIRASEPSKYHLLTDFLRRLKDRQVLPELQDVRQFAQRIGIKELTGKSRDDVLPKLIRFMSEFPLQTLRKYIAGAEYISEEQRQSGFSVLTDKILGK